MRTSLLALAFGFIAHGVAAHAPAAEDGDVFTAARMSVVKLVNSSAGGRTFSGSGVVLADGIFVTNCHVIQDARALAVGKGHGPLRAVPDGVDRNHDLCRVRADALKLRPATPRDARTLRVGEQVFAVGHSLGRPMSWRRGRVEQLYPMDGGVVIRTSASFPTGASGGGLFDADGKLVGKLTFYRVIAGNGVEYFAVPVEWIAGIAAIATLDAESRRGAPFWAQSLDRQPHFLQAATLELEGRWDELLSLSREWTARHPADGHAWSALTRSLDRAGAQAMAEAAFRRAEE